MVVDVRDVLNTVQTALEPVGRASPDLQLLARPARSSTGCVSHSWGTWEKQPRQPWPDVTDDADEDELMDSAAEDAVVVDLVVSAIAPAA